MDYNKWQRELKATKIVEVLNQKGYMAVYAKDGKEAFNLVDEFIEPNSTIAFGGSMTLKKYGITEHLLSDKYNALNRYNQPDYEAEVACYREGMTAQYLVTSTNAITMNGELVNMDSAGNRCFDIMKTPDL